MSFLPNRLSSAIVWGMIPLAAWGGVPSTGCLCANGQQKLFCSHRYRTGDDERGQSGKAKLCCCDHGALDGPASHDCCATNSDASGWRAKGCHCTPIFTSPATKPAAVTVAAELDRAMAIHLAAVQLPARAPSTVATKAAGHNRGPPIDLVITFGRLLI